MTYAIELTSSAQRALRKLHVDARQRVADVINELACDPRPHGVAKLSGEDDIYRVRTGDYRVLYQIIDSRLIVLVVHVGHRRDVYR